MFRRKDRDGWWTTKGGEFFSLGKKESAARKEFMRIHGQDDAEAAQGGLRVADILNEYLTWSEANHSPKTHYRIKLNVESFSQFLSSSGLRLRKLMPLHLTKWLDVRCPKHRADGKKPTSDNTRHGYAADVMGAFTWAVKQRMIPHSPLTGFTKAPKTPRISYLAPEQMDELLAEIKDCQFRDLVIVALRTGCRPGELRVLEAKHVLLKEGVARIPKKLAKGKRKERLVPLDETVLAILKPLVLKYPEGALFRNLRGDPWRKDAIKDRFRRLREKLSFDVTAYSMRHTFVTEGQKAGVPDSVLAQICGHEDTSMISKVYGHARLDNDVLRSAVGQVNRRAAGA
jgi:integrase